MLRSVVVVTPEPRPERIAGAVAPVAVGPAERLTAAVPQSATAAPAYVLPEIPWATVALVALFAGVAARGLWLAVGVLRLRRLRRLAMLVDSPDYAAAQQQVGTSAAIAQVEGLPQPVTFGFRRPIVLLPDTLAAAPAALRRAVVTHELFHVRRRDWLSVLGEEALRTLLWFHPAILWLTSHIQLAREEMVDELTVRATGDRRAYMQALLAFADTGGVHPAPAFAHRRQLFHRILSVSKEKVMSAAANRGVHMVCGRRRIWRELVREHAVSDRQGGTCGQAHVDDHIKARAETSGHRHPDRRRRVGVPTVRGRCKAASAASVTPENPIPRRTRGVPPIPSLNAKRGNTIACLSDDVEARALEQAGKPFSEEDIVVGNHDPSGRRAAHLWKYPRCGHLPPRLAVCVRQSVGPSPGATLPSPA